VLAEDPRDSTLPDQPPAAPSPKATLPTVYSLQKDAPRQVEAVQKIAALGEVLAAAVEQHRLSTAADPRPASTSHWFVALQRKVAKALGDLTIAWGVGGEGFRQLLTIHESFPIIMAELGWPPPTDMGPSQVTEIVRGYEALGANPTLAAKDAFRDTIEPSILTLYDDDLLRLKASGWRSKRLLAKRMHILDAAVEAHRQGNYLLSVPALLAQAEGIIADGVNHPGRMGGKLYEEFVTGLFASGVHEQITAAINKAVVSFWRSVLYVGFEHGQVVGSPLSRHAIMHGGDVDYGTQQGSLKAILLVDLLQDAFRFTTVEGSPVYHSGDCSALANTKGAIRFLGEEQEAVEAGKRPCKRCL
jgi:hypothetical protein